jgi:hypothetical protein
MRTQLRMRFWIESALATVCAFLLILTVLVKDWIELIFGFDPDEHSGSAEWLFVAAFATALVTLGSLAWREWHQVTAQEM